MNQSNNNKIDKDSLLFEYPQQENIRSYLRLEYLFKQFQRNHLATNQDNHFHALKILFEILEILARGDTRSELIKELSRLAEYFQALEANPQVDSSKLSNFLKQIQLLNQWVNKYKGKFGDSIRQNAFIESVKNRAIIPGGLCQFDCPELYIFLNKPHQTRQQMLTEWMEDIKGVETSIEVILRLIRDTGKWTSQQAPLGSFMLETTEQPFKLLRIRKITNNNIFPEFSCGKHRSSIHFMTFNHYQKKMPANSKIEFELACCY